MDIREINEIFFNEEEKTTIKNMDKIVEKLCDFISDECSKCPFQYFCNSEGDHFDFEYSLKPLSKKFITNLKN